MHFQLKYRHQPIPCIHLDMPIAKFSCKIPFFSYFLHTDPAHIWATCWSNCMMRWNPFPLQPPPWSVIWRTTCGRVAGKGVYWMLSFYMVLPAYWQGSHYTQNLASIINVFLFAVFNQRGIILLGCLGDQLSVSLCHLLLPDPPPTDLLDFQSLPVSAISTTMLAHSSTTYKQVISTQ